MIGILVFPDFQLLDAAGPISVFEIGARFAEERTVDQGGGGDAGTGALFLGRRDDGARAKAVGRDHHLDRAGGEGVRQAAACEKRSASCARLPSVASASASVCSGAYILAEAGLLDGRRATTHWQRTRHFLKAYPQVKLEPDRIFVRDGDVWTSAGISAGIDLSLAMIAEDYGDEIAQKAAKQLVLYHRRSGGQSQFSSLLELKAPNGRFGPLLAWAREHLDAPLTVEDLAEQAGMSSRHFTRAFMAETGTTPSKAVERLAHRGGAAARAVLQRGDRARRANHRLSRSGADAPRLHPRLRPAAAIAAPRGAGGVGLEHDPESGSLVWCVTSISNREVSSNRFARGTLRPADELINIQAIVLALDEMRSPADEMEAVGQSFKNLPADQGDRLGVRVNRLAKALQPLGCVHGVADDRVIDPVGCTDVTDHDCTHMNADPNANRLESRSGPSLVFRGYLKLYGNGCSASRRRRVLYPAWRTPEGHHGIPDKFVYGAAFLFDAGGDEGEVVIDVLGDLASGQFLACCGETHDVGKHDGKFALLGTRADPAFLDEARYQRTRNVAAESPQAVEHGVERMRQVVDLAKAAVLQGSHLVEVQGADRGSASRCPADRA
jgi:transcriptional regulator GlxA family with amidase domain